MIDALVRRWWEVAALALAANSVLFGFLGLRSGELVYAALAGFVPALMLVAAVATRAGRLGTLLAVGGSALAAFSYWMVYPVVLGALVVVGRLGPFGRPATSP